MYITKVEDLIGRVIDDFYSVVILNNQKIERIKKEVNFIKSQRELNEFIANYIKTISPSEITDIVKKGDSYVTIFETLLRYVFIYLFLTLGIFYKGKPEAYINNIIEFSRNQAEYPTKISNFFNSESNSFVIKLYYMCRNILTLLGKDAIKMDYIKKEPYAAETISFLTDELNDEYITAAFRLKSLNNDVSLQSHNIIKTILVLLVYKVIDKKPLYAMIEQSEQGEGEYMFIDIVEPITDTINFTTIESLLSKRDIFAGLAYDIWDYMGEYEEKQRKVVTHEDKINFLINSGIVVPILDDFLLYHRDNERYDKTNLGNGQTTQQAAYIKQKEDTKIRYIISKIDTTAELYSDAASHDAKLKSNIMKNFSVPFYNKKAILRNNVEEIKIINKFINQGKRNVENNDYFNDLIGYRRYTYINFKDFDKYGFSHYFTKTVTAVRAVNFDTTSEFKQTNLNNRLQLRVGGKDSIGNIVGFMIPTNVKSIKCVKLSDTVNIHEISKKNKNGFYLFLNFLRRSVIKGENHNASVYWIFDQALDKVKYAKKEANETASKQDSTKMMIAELYNKIVEDIYFDIIDKIDVHSQITLVRAAKIVTFIEDSILGIPLSQDMRDDIEKYVFEKKLASLDVSQINSDILYGLEGDTFKLPIYKKETKNEVKRITLDLAHIDESGKIIERETVEGICQHNITWDNLNKIRKTDYAEYMKQMYDFIQQYVVENIQHDYVCKSCGFYLDIKKYVQDGVFDDEKGFITFSMPMEANLEELPDYEKYQFAIKIMDKNIEKIASSVGIPYFIGNAVTIKWRRKAIIKSTIDMVTQNNQMLTKTFKERNELKTKMYGVSKLLSSLFVFDMENNIFQTSSKDKDQEQFKIIKRNNIITYIMIYMILELNDSQISFFLSDKKNLCDIRIFDKVYQSLFAGLRVKRNNTNDTVDITNYKILCYLIYMLSCRIAKHRMWGSLQTTDKNILKMIPNTQRYIVHTCIDIINSVLENSFQPGVSYIFEIFRVRFYSKLDTLFNDDDYYDLLLNQVAMNFISAKKRAHLRLVDANANIPFTYNPVQWRTVLPGRFYPPLVKRTEFKLNGVSNLSNCPDGQFHKWKIENGTPVCGLCKVLIRDLKYSETETVKIVENFKTERSNLLAQKYCLVDGDFHQYKYDTESGKNKCVKCKKTDDNKYTLQEIEKIDIVIDEINIKRRDTFDSKIKEYNEFTEKERKYITKVVEKNNEDYKKDFNREEPYSFMDSFVMMLQSHIGNELKGEYPINLKNNTYIIDHDYAGLDLGGKNIVIIESDNKIYTKKNHPHFKTDVIYYTDKTSTPVDVFYDMITRKLLGYKEASRDYVDIKRTDKKIKINYSIYNKLKLLGYSNEYINIDDDYKTIRQKYDAVKLKAKSQAKNDADYQLLEQQITQKMYNEIVQDITRLRIENIKNTILEFQRIFNRIINGHAELSREKIFDRRVDADNIKYPKQKNPDKQQDPDKKYAYDDSTYFGDKINTLVEKYKRKLKNVNISNKNGNHRIFKHWKGIVRGINMEIIDDKYFNFSSDLIESENVSRYDPKGILLLYYFINQMKKLLDYNSEGYIKTNICHFLVEFIDRIFFRYNTEQLHTNNDIKRFMYAISSVGFFRETEIQLAKNEDNPNGFYEEYVGEEEPTDADVEEKIDEFEEREALDLDMDADDIEENAVSMYDNQVDIDIDFEEHGMEL